MSHARHLLMQDLFNMHGIYSRMNEAMQDQSRSINKKKEELVYDRLKQLDRFDVMQTATHRFPKINITIQDGWEKYYVDNGTENGLFVIGFKNSEPVQKVENGNVTFSIDVIIAYLEDDTMPKKTKPTTKQDV